MAAPRLLNCLGKPVAVRTADGPYLLEEATVPALLEARRLRDGDGRVEYTVSTGTEEAVIEAAHTSATVLGLPEPEDGVLYLVDPGVLAASKRPDLVAPVAFAASDTPGPQVLVAATAPGRLRT